MPAGLASSLVHAPSDVDSRRDGDDEVVDVLFSDIDRNRAAQATRKG